MKKLFKTSGAVSCNFSSIDLAARHSSYALTHTSVDFSDFFVFLAFDVFFNVRFTWLPNLSIIFERRAPNKNKAKILLLLYKKAHWHVVILKKEHFIYSKKGIKYKYL